MLCCGRKKWHCWSITPLKQLTSLWLKNKSHLVMLPRFCSVWHQICYLLPSVSVSARAGFVWEKRIKTNSLWLWSSWMFFLKPLIKQTQRRKGLWCSEDVKVTFKMWVRYNLCRNIYLSGQIAWSNDAWATVQFCFYNKYRHQLFQCSKTWKGKRSITPGICKIQHCQSLILKKKSHINSHCKNDGRPGKKLWS